MKGRTVVGLTVISIPGASAITISSAADRQVAPKTGKVTEARSIAKPPKGE